MLGIILAVIIASFCIQLQGYLAVKTSGPINTETLLTIATLCLPTAFLSAMAYAYFFGKGYQFASYPSLQLTANTFALLTAMSVQVLILKDREFDAIEAIGIAVGFLGCLIVVYRDEIRTLLG